MAQASRFFFRDADAYEEKAARKNLTAETAAAPAEQARAALAQLADWTAPRFMR